METRRPHDEEALESRALLLDFLRLAALVALVGFGVAVGWRSLFPREVTAEATTQPKVRRVVGTVTSSGGKSIAPLISGKVGELRVRRGQRVQRGQLLFRIHAGAAQARVSSARQDSVQAAAELGRLQARRDARVKAHRANLARLAAAVQRQRAALGAAQAGVRRARAAGSPTGAPSPALRAAYGQVTLAAERLRHLKGRHTAAAAAMEAEERSWARRIQPVAERVEAAKLTAAQARERLKLSKRFSPISGIVTSVKAHEGAWVAKGTPILRVDDPTGFRVVALVDEQAREPLSEGMTLSLGSTAGEWQAKVAEIRPGWGRELFRYWVILRPEGLDGLSFGDRVPITLPARAPEAQVAEAGAEPE